jgi:hypothetical protein
MIRYTLVAFGLVGIVLAQARFVSVVGGAKFDCPQEQMIITPDSGIALLGYNNPFGGDDNILLSKFDASGNHLWTREMGGFGHDRPKGLACTQDGGFAIAGYVDNVPLGLGEIFLARFDASGNCLWSRIVTGTYREEGTGLTETQDGGFAVVGWTTSFGAGNEDALLAKFDASGNLLWVKTLGSDSTDEVYDVAETPDGGLVIAGQTYGFGAGGYSNALISKFNASGNHLWTRAFGGPEYDGIYYFHLGDHLAIAPNGDLVYMAQTWISGQEYALLARFSTTGNLLWARSLGGGSLDRPYDFTLTGDGGMAITGVTSSYGAGGNDAFVSKFDSSGNHLWTRTLGGTNADVAVQVESTQDNGLVIGGYTWSFGSGYDDMFVAKFDQGGNLLWAWTLNGSGADELSGLIETPDGGLVAAAYTSTFNFGGMGDIVLVGFDSNGNTCMGQAISPTVTSPSPTITQITTVTNLSPVITTPSPAIYDTLMVMDPGFLDTVLCYVPVDINEVMAPRGLWLRASGNCILFNLPVPADARLSVYDPSGRLVARPVDGFTESGEHEIVLGLKRGVYFVELRYPGGTKTTRAIVR